MTARRRTNQRRACRGIAAVEMAACIPLLFTLVFGSLQACNLLFLKHALTTGAYEGTLEASKPSASRDSVTERVENILTAYGIQDAVIQIEPVMELDSMSSGTDVTIRVTASVAPNVMGPAIVIPATELSAFGVTMR